RRARGRWRRSRRWRRLGRSGRCTTETLSMCPLRAEIGRTAFRESGSLEAGLLPFPRTGCVPDAGPTRAPDASSGCTNLSALRSVQFHTDILHNVVEIEPRPRRLRAARPAGRPALGGRGIRRRHPPGDPRAIGTRRLDQRRLHHARPARGQAVPAVVDGRSDSAARRTPAQGLRAHARGRRGPAAGLPAFPRHGRRPRAPPGGEMTTAPPRLAARLVSWRVSAERRDFVLGDLEEEFAARAAIDPGAARRWYWRQAIRCLGGSFSLR